MARAFIYLLAAAVLMTAVLPESSYAQTGAAAPPPPTLWSFLGIPQGIRKVRGALTNRRGNRPRTEPKEPLKALNDPENLESENPAIKKAAEVKQEEDAKPQKIKAIKYLTKIGCGCYDKDGSVSDALVAAAEDCTEDVRLVTMQQIKEAAEGKCCANCGQVCCCNEKILKKLAELAYEKDEFGCYLEPSSRVRSAAAEALQACCPGSPPLEILAEEPEEEPEEPEEIKALPEEEEELQEAAPEDVESEDQAEDLTLSSRARRSNRTNATGVSLRFSDGPDLTESHSTLPGIDEMRQLMLVSAPVPTRAADPSGGVVMAFDSQQNVAYVHFANKDLIVRVGRTVHLRQDSRFGQRDLGNWEVVESGRGCANIMPVAGSSAAAVNVGDQVDLGPPPVYTTRTNYVRQR